MNGKSFKIKEHLQAAPDGVYEVEGHEQIDVIQGKTRFSRSGPWYNVLLIGEFLVIGDCAAPPQII